MLTGAESSFFSQENCNEAQRNQRDDLLDWMNCYNKIWDETCDRQAGYPPCEGIYPHWAW